MLNLKTILVPVDFSSHSQAALVQACYVAELSSAHIRLVHFYSNESQSTELSQKWNRFCQVLGSNTELNFPDIISSKNKVNIQSKISIDIENIFGDPLIDLSNLTKNGMVDLVIMGKRGEHDVIDQLMGTVSSDMVENSSCPVLLLLKQNELKSIQESIYTVSDYSCKGGFLPFALHFVKALESSLSYVHIEVWYKNSKELFHQIQQRTISEKLPLVKTNFQIIEGLNIANELNEFAETNKIGLLITAQGEKGFFKNIFNQNISRELSHISNMPLLILK